jgi:hypothetical protein
MTTTMVLSLAGNTSAKVLERDSFHDEFSERVRNFCDVSGLTVRQDFTIDGRFAIKSRGSQQLPYFQQHGRVRVVTTNVATGEFVTEVSRTLEKDLHITNNGDGTLTILVLATGNAVVYDENGKAIARNPGQVRFELLIDHGGTPRTPPMTSSSSSSGSSRSPLVAATTSAPPSRRHSGAEATGLFSTLSGLPRRPLPLSRRLLVTRPRPCRAQTVVRQT